MIGTLKVMKNEAFMLSFQIPNILIDSLTNFLAYEYDILSFLIIQSLTLIFMEKNKTFKRKMTFISSKKKNYILSWFSEREGKHISSLSFLERRKNIFSCSLIFQGESVLTYRNKNNFFVFFLMMVVFE